MMSPKEAQELYPIMKIDDLQVSSIGEAKGRQKLGLEKMLLPEYQSDDVFNCLVLFPLCSIRFNN